jgi:beta-phosphoglucomutase-like phosphatase (HAD superfamily)
MIKSIIFDMDGVLIDAKDWHYDALNRALGLFGMEISRYDHLITYDGLPTKKKLQMLSSERLLSESLHSFINDMKQIYTMELVYSNCKPLFFHEYALSRFTQEGYTLAVASNSVRNTVDVMMDRAHLQKYLSLSLSNEDVSSPKPDPEIYIKAIQQLGRTPEECLIIEDNENGLLAAKRSGAHVMKVNKVEDVNYDSITRFINSITKDIK